MHVFNCGASWDEGGPAVFHSLWWITAHWGRAFEFLHLQPVGWGFEKGSRYGQGIAVMRKRPGDLTPENLEALEPDEPREVDALNYSLRNTRRETAFRQREVRHFAGLLSSERARLAKAQATEGRKLEQARRDLKRQKRRRERARKEARAYGTSLSWRVTAPARALVRLAVARASGRRVPESSS